MTHPGDPWQQHPHGQQGPQPQHDQQPQYGQPQQNPWAHPQQLAGTWQDPGGPNRAYDRLAIRQKIALTVNRYEVRGLDQAGNQGELIAFAEQKRFAFKEHVTFYTDETRSVPVFSFKARQVLDLGATYDVFDGAMQPIGWFRKDFGKSLFRSTWHLGDPSGFECTGRERSMFVAILRRLSDDSWFLNNWYSFDFVTPDGQNVLHHARASTFRDCYAVDLPMFNGGQRLDWRLGAAMGVALDALQGR